MKNFKRVTLPPGGGHSRNLKPAPFRNLPPELCALIAHSASRQSLARLCSTSRRFCFIFSPLLYANTVEPPLNTDQAARLTKTLIAPQTRTWKSHPAVHVRHLSLMGYQTYYGIKTSPQQPISALVNTYRLMPDAERTTRGSALRTLHWNFAGGVDMLSQILNDSGHFPSLTDLRFIQVEGLEVLGVALDLRVRTHNDSDLADSLCYLFADALESLPTTSPSLRGLRLKIKIPFNNPFPYLGLDTLADAINQIHLPALTTLELSLDFYPINLDPEEVEHLLPLVDFSPLLAAHPNLLDLTLTANGTTLPKDVAFLPRLRSFAGSFDDAVFVCANHRQLDRLVLTFILVHHPYLEEPSFRAPLPLPPQTSLTELTVRAVDTVGAVVKSSNELTPTSLAHLTTSLPNLTHLDVYLSNRIADYRKSLSRLSNLQSLRVQEYRRPLAARCISVNKIFPAAEYTKELAQLLPSLPHLTTVEVDILGDPLKQHSCCDCCESEGCSDDESEDHYYDDDDRRSAEMRVNYRFSISRTSSGAKVVLRDTQVRDERRERRD
ncbi:hypothetical protein C8R46DRAFT_1244116 [Mycena filopes]|nr:hypothetical protein C8R46DRAFT_1244116 [Mycena filopes]